MATNSNKLIKTFTQNPLAAVLITFIVLLVCIKILSGPKQEYYETQGVISNTKSAKPDDVARETKNILNNKKSGIVSFEMYIPETRKAPERRLSRSEIIQEIVDSVSRASDEVNAKNSLIDQISSLDFKINGMELLTILQSAGISDSFYYSNAIKSVAPILDYPISEALMKKIIEPVSDSYYRHKLFDELVKEQKRNQ